MVTYCAWPSTRVPWSVMNGAVALSTRIVVSALILCERPMGCPRSRMPCQNSSPLAGSWVSTFPRWCSCIKMIWGGVGSEASQDLTCFGLDLFPLNPLTLREARVRAFSIIG